MDLDTLLKDLPDHWEMWSAEESKDVWWDDGRDCDKPVFLRKDGLARIYFNDSPSNSCVFSIAFDYHSDGECYPDFKEALNYSDKYVATFPLEYHKCRLCDTKAVWCYMPATETVNNKDRYHCDKCIPRGCSCNGEDQPCIEHDFNEYGFVKE